MRSLALALFVLALGAAAHAGDDPAAEVERFHAALASGDVATVEALLAPDAIVLESGLVESRAEYVEHHLPADIAFSRAVAQVRSDVRVVREGSVAWVSARSAADGELRGRVVRSDGAELIVLARTGEGWRIRAIHWSSHERNPPAAPTAHAAP
jgi:ketosteroid isomerase-like protein